MNISETKGLRGAESLAAGVARTSIRFASIIMLTLMATIFAVADAVAQSPESLPSPNAGNPNNYIADPYDLLSRNTETYVNERLARVRKKTSAEVGVAIVKNLDGMSVEDYSYRLFKHWGLGKADKNNGVLLVIAVDDKQCRIEVGSGAEGVMTDIACANIIRGYIIPAMKSNNLNQAVSGGVNEIADVLTNPDVADEIRSADGDTALGRIKGLNKSVILDFILLVMGFVFVFTLAMFIYDLVVTHKRDNYRRAMTWRSHISTYWWGAALSLGTALPIAIAAYLLYRHSRDVKEICDTCGAKMNKLSEDEDNAFLSASQDFEEKLGTVDYDVWLCPECGTVERFPFVERQLKYRECPDCHTIAMNLVMDKVVDPPTATKAGHGERLYQCQYCKHIRREGYVIPKNPNGAAMLGAGLAAGAMLGRGGRNGGGGSGFGGGGFGGGSSSGGGASGGW